MIVKVTADSAVVLVDERNFKALKVEAAGNLGDDLLVQSLGAPGPVDDGHIWLPILRLRCMGPHEASWQKNFDDMIAYAGKAGWVSADGSAVRAHVERSPTLG